LLEQILQLKAFVSEAKLDYEMIGCGLSKTEVVLIKLIGVGTLSYLMTFSSGLFAVCDIQSVSEKAKLEAFKAEKLRVFKDYMEKEKSKIIQKAVVNNASIARKSLRVDKASYPKGTTLVESITFAFIVRTINDEFRFVAFPFLSTGYSCDQFFYDENKRWSQKVIPKTQNN
jgi:hypothetical protein